MNRIFYAALLVVTAMILTSCATTFVELKPTGPKGRQVYKITALGFSRDIRDGAINNAGEYCKKQNKHFKFVKNIFVRKSMAGVEMMSVDLFFLCLDEQPAEPIPPPETEAGEEEIPVELESLPVEVVPAAAPEPAPARKKPVESTGDSPGGEESLGDPPPDSSVVEMEPAQQDGVIIEQILDE